MSNIKKKKKIQTPRKLTFPEYTNLHRNIDYSIINILVICIFYFFNILNTFLIKKLAES